MLGREGPICSRAAVNHVILSLHVDLSCFSASDKMLKAARSRLRSSSRTVDHGNKQSLFSFQEITALQLEISDEKEVKQLEINDSTVKQQVGYEKVCTQT
jgi:hypothetical protein